MSKRTVTTATLAAETNSDIDDILLLLWDAGIEYPNSADSRIRATDIGRARAACGASSVKDRLTVEYWMILLNLTRDEFASWTEDRGIRIGSNARRLPKGALARLDREIRTDPKLLARAAHGATLTTSQQSKRPSRKPPTLKFDFRNIGHSRAQVRHLSSVEIEEIHHHIAADFASTPDPIAPAGVRSRPLLESAAGRPHTGMMGQLKYPTIEMGAAALIHSVIHNHPFYNGNKRTALVAMLAFLDENGIVLGSDHNEIFRWTVRIASHRLGADLYEGDRSDVEVHLMARWLVQHCRNLESGERVITFQELRRRLLTHGCTVEFTSSGGGKALVQRIVPSSRRRKLFSPKSETLRYYLNYGGDGRQVARGRIRDMRSALRLSDEFGVDSGSFYGTDTKPVDDFIAQYRKVLRRLARL